MEIGTYKAVRTRSGQYAIEGFWHRLWSNVKWYTVWRILPAIILGVGIWAAYEFGQMEASREVVVKNVPVVEQMSILDRIAKAESGGMQFNQKTGLPIMHANLTGVYAGSIDIGKYGINDRIWGVKAKELGYDLLTEKGNEQMARWLIANKGTEPWSASKVNWK